MFVIAVIKDEDLLLAAERERVSRWASTNDWTYVEYADAVDLLARITDLRSDMIQAKRLPMRSTLQVAMSGSASAHHSK